MRKRWKAPTDRSHLAGEGSLAIGNKCWAAVEDLCWSIVLENDRISTTAQPDGEQQRLRDLLHRLLGAAYAERVARFTARVVNVAFAGPSVRQARLSAFLAQPHYQEKGYLRR